MDAWTSAMLHAIFLNHEGEKDGLRRIIYRVIQKFFEKRVCLQSTIRVCMNGGLS
jgi:hypothetical protein